MGKCWRQLQRDDRLKIHAWIKAKTSVRQMAEWLGVSVSTIYREIARGQCLRRNSDWTEEYVYEPDVAQRHYEEGTKRRGRDLKIMEDLDLADDMEDLLMEGYSPAAVLVLLQKNEKEYKIEVRAVNSVYGYVKKGLFKDITMEELPYHKKPRKKKGAVRVQKRAQAGESISMRPEEIETREEFGHWEMDTVVGPRGKSEKALLVLTERKSRFEVVRYINNKSAREVVRALNGIERECGEKLFRQIFLTITVDNGGEFSDCEGIEASRRCKKPRTKVYYCHAYSSWERGSNENNNRFIRRKIPKGVNFDSLTRTEVKQIERWMNRYPRHQFGYACAEDIFMQELESLLAS